MRLIVRCNGTETPLELPANATLDDFKAAVASQHNVDPMLVRVIFHSKILKDNDSLDKYKIAEGDIVNVKISDVGFLLS